MNKDEELARKMYDVYVTVSGLNLADSDDLFKNTSSKVVKGWIAAADCAINILSVDEDGEL